MVSKTINIIILTLFFTSDQEAKYRQINTFLDGRWAANEVADTSLKSIYFFNGDCVDFLFTGDKYPTSIQKKYIINNIQLNKRMFSIDIYNENLFSKKTSIQSSFDVEIIDNDIIRVKNKKINTIFKRHYNKVRYK